MAKITEQDVLETMKKALGPKAANLTMNSTVKDTEPWDSLGHLGILAALDQKFDGKIAAIDEMATVDSVKRIIAILREHSLL